MIGRQLPLMAAILPFYVMALYGGWRSIRVAVADVAGCRLELRPGAIRRLQLSSTTP